MGVAPIGAIKKVLDRTGMTIDDIDVVELNEAFAAQVIPIMDECDIPLEKMNTHGGAIALGHPFGMTGARIMTTLLNVMETDDHAVGLETMCVAGGQGEAMIVERLAEASPRCLRARLRAVGRCSTSSAPTVLVGARSADLERSSIACGAAAIALRLAGASRPRRTRRRTCRPVASRVPSITSG